MLLKGKRIFLVEDDLKNRTIAELALEREGAVTAFERWGVDTVKKLKTFAPIDLVLLDLMFPNGVSGYEIFKEIRQEAEFQNIPIVAVSAANQSEAIPRAKAYGFTGFISKPIDILQFPRQLHSIIEGKVIWDEGSDNFRV